MIEERACAAEELTAAEWKEILELTHAAFAEHKQRGLRMLPCSVTMEEHKKFLQDAQVFLIRDNSVLIAYKAGLVIKTENNIYFQVRLTCVSPQHKGKGLGRQVHYMLEKWAIAQGCHYLQTDTSCKAKSSQAYHHACGFKNWYYLSWPTTNYYSIVLRKDLPTGQRMSRKSRWASLIRSYVLIHFKYTENGDVRFLFKSLRFMRRKLWGK